LAWCLQMTSMDAGIIQETDGVIPEDMARKMAGFIQQACNDCRWSRRIAIARRAKNSENCVLSNGACRPTGILQCSEPCIGSVMVRMRWIHQCYEYIDIQQQRHLGNSSLS